MIQHDVHHPRSHCSSGLTKAIRDFPTTMQYPLIGKDRFMVTERGFQEAGGIIYTLAVVGGAIIDILLYVQTD